MPTYIFLASVLREFHFVLGQPMIDARHIVSCLSSYGWYSAYRVLLIVLWLMFGIQCPVSRLWLTFGIQCPLYGWCLAVSCLSSYSWCSAYMSLLILQWLILGIHGPVYRPMNYDWWSAYSVLLTIIWLMHCIQGLIYRPIVDARHTWSWLLFL